MKTIATLLLTLLTLPAFADGPRVLQCETEDSNLQYRDIFTFTDENTATYQADMATIDSEDFQKVCWSTKLDLKRSPTQIEFTIDLKCIDNATGTGTMTLDLKTMLINGTWKQAYPCRWL